MLYFSEILLTNFIIPYFKKKSLYQQMSKRPDWSKIEETQNTLKKLFKGDRAKISSIIYRHLRFMTDKEYIYGEIDFLSFHTILEKAEPKHREVFYDLGSGAGKAVFTAALFFDLSKSCGIELLPPLFTKAKNKLKKAILMFQNNNSNFEKKYLKKVETIQFIHDSFLNHEFYDADIIYVAATCLSNQTWNDLIDKMASLKPGSRIIVATKSIYHDNFELIYQGVELMSWGLCPVKIYKIKEALSP